MQNITEGHNSTNGTKDDVEETQPEVVVIIIILCCVWIILVNGAVFVCLIIHRHAMKTFVNLQLLSFSITDIFVGISAVPGALTYYLTPNIEVCSMIMYAYFVAQTASLYHAFGICLHRYITVKHRQLHSKRKCKGQLKRVIIHVIVIWLISIVLAAIPIACYGRFDQSITECSLNKIFKDNYIKFLAVMNAVLLLPQVGMNVLYVCLYRYLSIKWRFNAGTKTMKQDLIPLTIRRLNSSMKATSDSMINNSERRGFNEWNNVIKKRGTDITLPLTKIDKQDSDASGFLGERIYACSDMSKYVSPKGHLDESQSDKETYMEQEQIKNDAKEFDKPQEANFEAPSNYINVLSQAEQHLQAEADSQNIREIQNRDASSYSRWTNISRQMTVSGGCKTLSHKKEKEVLYTIGIILVLLNIFITPLNLLFIIELIHDGFISRKVKLGLMFLALVNSGINPLVYALKLKPFRDLLKCHRDKCAGLCGSNSASKD